jgi:hypothetical protein
MSDAEGTPARPKRITSREILVQAVRWAVNQGIKVIASAAPGVICTSTAACEWQIDPTAEGINPLGAAILMRQRQVILSPNLDCAAFLAVGESNNWAEGFDAGIAGLAPDPSWAKHPDGPMFANGWACGRDFYNAAHLAARRTSPLVTCRHHPHVRYESNSGCPRCAREMAEDTVPDNRSEAERAEASGPNFMTPIVPGSDREGGARHGV